MFYILDKSYTVEGEPCSDILSFSLPDLSDSLGDMSGYHHSHIDTINPFSNLVNISSSKGESEGNTADILLSLKKVVVHQQHQRTPSPTGHHGHNSHPGSPHSRHGASYPNIGQADNVASQNWAEDGSSGGYLNNLPYNYSLDGYGWSSPSHHGGHLSRSGYTGGSPHLSSMSVNVSMNMTMHGLGVPVPGMPGPGYDQVPDQWPQGKYF